MERFFSEAWIQKFKLENHRAPRILHIGNIANNAYQNSKMLNQAGCDCDVLCNDYYHIMGCPEWDDANFTGDFGDPNYPDWKKVNLNGFKRPDWFVQGPLFFCVKYLCAKSKHHKLSMKFWWLLLNNRSKTIDSVGVFLRFLKRIVRIVYLFIFHPKQFIKKFKFFYRRKVLKQHQEFVIAESKAVKKFKSLFAQQFPDRKCIIGEITEYYLVNIDIWKKLFHNYDVVVGYATSSIWPFLAEIENYVTYEHGTIRDMPYDGTEFSQLLLLSYANARSIYVTNIDCYESAEYISQNSEAEIVCGLHGIDVDRIIKKIELAKETKGFDARFGAADTEKVFFAPARHDFDLSRGTFLKGNDQIIEAAYLLKKEFKNFKLVLIKWGKDVQKIEDQIEQYPDLKDHIIWHEPIGKVELYKTFLTVDAVLDQFILRAFGAITIETLCAGNAVLITREIPEVKMIKFYGEALPAFLCNSAYDIYNSMKEVMQVTVKYEKLQNSSRLWIEKYHSKEKIIETNIKAYSYCLELLKEVTL